MVSVAEKEIPRHRHAHIAAPAMLYRFMMFSVFCAKKQDHGEGARMCRSRVQRAPTNVGAFSLYGQLSGKLSDLPLYVTYSVCDLYASRHPGGFCAPDC